MNLKAVKDLRVIGDYNGILYIIGNDWPRSPSLEITSVVSGGGVSVGDIVAAAKKYNKQKK